MRLKALSEKVRSGCPGELLYYFLREVVDALALARESIDGLRCKLEAWKITLASNKLGVEVK